MKITKLEEQGLRLTLCLGRADGQLTLPELADKEGLSEALVAKVLSKLKNGGVVKAVRGRNGGYELGGPPQTLTVSTILRSLGRPIVDGCFQVEAHCKKGGSCSHSNDCSIRPMLACIEEKVTTVLDGITLAQLISREQDIKEHMYINGINDRRKGPPELLGLVAGTM